MNDLVERISWLLKNQGITAKVLTEKLKLNKSAISDWKSGKTKPSVDALRGISEIFNISLDWLVTGRESIYASIDLTDEEKEVISTYRRLGLWGRVAVLNTIKEELERNVGDVQVRPVVEKKTRYVPVEPKSKSEDDMARHNLVTGAETLKG